MHLGAGTFGHEICPLSKCIFYPFFVVSLLINGSVYRKWSKVKVKSATDDYLICFIRSLQTEISWNKLKKIDKKFVLNADIFRAQMPPSRTF